MTVSDFFSERRYPMDEMDFAPDILSLTDEEGKEHKFEILGETDHEGDHYIALLPAGELSDLDSDGEIVILKSVFDEELDEEVYYPEEDEDRLLAVYNAFQELFSDMFDFEEEA